ncbi:2-dehydro-3-deoxygalactonokinase [Shinella zoogloeoides]|uniref:2-dehydro-3-deoxygalactonokinase n=1 Tax=Shinella zoogloeoides TaxID=352475 RepID=A0A6N8TC44_SHIZO|nr:2-dehydro-3-deoxygalactonokinase [Shinella zoogloeoides]MXO00005.1 2-dehydro-3-deoxygalactonokinase [Shinella zoogloeoides]UEX82346.1 2-dehydro-3-deoxygalactonokinase [Shinella zoogloeoides]
MTRSDPHPAYVAVDWGTSSFRLWLIGQDGGVLAERRSAEGMTVAARTGFAGVLASHLAAISAPAGLPVLICGMAGAKQGWVEAGYLDTPAALAAIPAAAVRIPGVDADIRILPGLAQRDAAAPDVMRGEETQLLGAAGELGSGDHLVCMPGTHSKWVRLSGGRVEGFSTFMTGELFDAIAKNTILSHAIAEAGAVQGDNAAFRAAVKRMVDNPALATSQLFSVRAGSLIAGLSPDDAKARLSGTLIGLEIAGALSMVAEGTPVALVVSGGLGAPYRQALAAAGLSPFVIDADTAVRNGLAAGARALWSL